MKTMTLDPQTTFLCLSTDSETGNTGRHICRLFIVRLCLNSHNNLSWSWWVQTLKWPEGMGRSSDNLKECSLEHASVLQILMFHPHLAKSTPFLPFPIQSLAVNSCTRVSPLTPYHAFRFSSVHKINNNRIFFNSVCVLLNLLALLQYFFFSISCESFSRVMDS